MFKLPENIPNKGFYYHYKHDPKGSVNNYSYEVLGVGHHTEDDCREMDEFMVVYRPLYVEATVYKMGKLFDIRPLSMFLEKVNINSIEMERFQRITDPKIIEQLKEIKKQLYD